MYTFVDFFRFRFAVAAEEELKKKAQAVKTPLERLRHVTTARTPVTNISCNLHFHDLADVGFKDFETWILDPLFRNRSDIVHDYNAVLEAAANDDMHAAMNISSPWPALKYPLHDRFMEKWPCFDTAWISTKFCPVALQPDFAEFATALSRFQKAINELETRKQTQHKAKLRQAQQQQQAAQRGLSSSSSPEDSFEQSESSSSEESKDRTSESEPASPKSDGSSQHMVRGHAFAVESQNLTLDATEVLFAPT